MTFATIAAEEEQGSNTSDVARQALRIYNTGKAWQAAMNSLELCTRPIIACVHNGCIGAGLEMISAADIRFCTSDSFFIYKEVDVGMAADVGGLQRFPKLVGSDSLVRELVFSGRKMDAGEADKLGLVSRILPTKEKMMEAAIELGSKIASKSPIATIGAKKLMNYARDHSVAESLEYAIVWNMAMLQGRDLKAIVEANMMKKKPSFGDLPKANL